MAGSLNKVILIGNVGRDPEIRTTTSGDRIANLSIATSETWKDRSSGERKERTEWHRVSIFNDHLVKVVEDYVKKGSSICVEGQLQTRKWTDKDGAEKFSTEVVLTKFKGDLTLLGSAPGEREERRDDAHPRRDPPPGPRENFSADLDDEIPF